MFGARFGLLRFGLHSQQESELSIKVNFTDTLQCLAGFGATIYVEENLFDGLQGSVKLTPTIPIKFSSNDELKNTTVITAGIIVKFDSEDNLKSKCNVIKDLILDEEFSNDLSCNVYVSKDIHESESLKDSLKSSASVYKNLITKEVFTDILNSYISSVVLENDIIQINVTIPPGGLLEIRSDTYDVFLNGENILELQKGDWIFLDRDTVSINLDSGSGGQISGRILYNERFL